MSTALNQKSQYQQTFLQGRQGVYMNYPAHVHIETLSLCTAACNFCPYPSLDRIGERMSDTLITKILTDLQDIPRHIPIQISPFKVNEPFLDTRIFDIMGTINADLPNAEITLTSNASPLTPKNLDKLTKIQNVKYLWISFNDHRPAQYTATMQLPWERTIERLTMLHKAKADGRFTPKVILSRVGDGSPADLDFRIWVMSQFPLFETHIFQRGGWLGQADVKLNNPVPDVACQRWFELSIMSSGKVAHCCMDGKGEWSIGDVNTAHVLEVYNAPDYRRLREELTSRKQTSPCDTCTFL